MNKVVLIGRLTKDPELKYTPGSGTAVTTITLAVDRRFSKDGQREADFINIVVWGKPAELCGNSLSKGQRLLTEGRLQIRNYVGKDGNKRYVTEVIADRVEFIERRNSGAGPATGTNQAPKEEASSMENFGAPVEPDDEIPF